MLNDVDSFLYDISTTLTCMHSAYLQLSLSFFVALVCLSLFKSIVYFFHKNCLVVFTVDLNHQVFILCTCTLFINMKWFTVRISQMLSSIQLLWDAFVCNEYKTGN